MNQTESTHNWNVETRRLCNELLEIAHNQNKVLVDLLRDSIFYIKHYIDCDFDDESYDVAVAHLDLVEKAHARRPIAGNAQTCWRDCRDCAERDNMEAGMTEAEEQKLIMEYAKHHPKIGRLIRYNSGRKGNIKFNSATGHSDLLGWFKTGQVFAWETKAAGKFPTAEQYDFLRSVADNGGLAGHGTFASFEICLNAWTRGQ